MDIDADDDMAPASAAHEYILRVIDPRLGTRYYLKD